MMRRMGLTLVLALMGVPLVAPGGVQAQAADPAIETYRLPNGLRVVLAPEPTATTVAVNVWYDAGSRREPPGRSGFAHLFEHLMFEGSENLEPGEHATRVIQAGGTYNAYLIVDNTAYFQTLPPNRYNLALWLEAERMRNLEVTEENLRREIEVVKEERRFSFENSPYGMSRLEAWFYLPFDSVACFPYAHSQIGSPTDLDAATLDDVRTFFEQYYNPNNATLTVAGAFEPAEARTLISQYFGPIPRGPDPPAIRCDNPFDHLPVRRTMEDPNATLPGLMHSYGTIPATHDDAPALNLLVSILADGQSSRFNQRLVREEQVALQVSGFTWDRVGPGLVWLFAVANQGVEMDDLERLLDAELERVRREGVTEEELEKARNSYLASTLRERQTMNGYAEAIQWHTYYFGDPGAMQARLDQIRRLTVEDLRRVANTYFTPDNRAVVVTLPAQGGN